MRFKKGNKINVGRKPWNKGKSPSEESRRKISEARKGKIPWNKKAWRPFKEARKIVCSLQLKNMREWRQYRKSNKKPDDIPSHPEKIYKNNGWKGWADWLGNENRTYSEETRRKTSEWEKAEKAF
ncbi:MAG: hypothetical protein EX285_03695 [Thaumarchaeota archaeon]|nr:hypothetical protein [Nitrososphaerota archaeon]